MIAGLELAFDLGQCAGASLSRLGQCPRAALVVALNGAQLVGFDFYLLGQQRQMGQLLVDAVDVLGAGAAKIAVVIEHSPQLRRILLIKQ